MFLVSTPTREHLSFLSRLFDAFDRQRSIQHPVNWRKSLEYQLLLLRTKREHVRYNSYKNPDHGTKDITIPERLHLQ